MTSSSIAIRLAGLVLAAMSAIPAAAEITYAREISRILQAKCERCHREGDIAPFVLKSYDDAFGWKDDIRRVVEQRIMPPWKPVAGHGEFRDNFGLTEEEQRWILEWVDSGAPFGFEEDLPEPLEDRGAWALGEPDLVVEMPEPYEPPRGQDMYRCFVLPTPYEESRFVSAVDVLPGERRFVHHVILYLDTTGKAEELDAAEEGPGYTCFGGPGTTGFINIIDGTALGLGGWAPGTRPAHLPEGIGLHLPAKARIVMQVHYFARGGTAPDQTRVGLYLSKAKVEKPLRYIPLVQTRLAIPAGDERYTTGVQFPVPPLFDMHVINVFPHMHLLGTEIEASVRRGTRETPLIRIDNWDFNWQGPYQFVEPVPVSAFSLLRLSCTYNNSASNPRNPNDPLKVVRWGEGTEDEMCLTFLGVTLDREQLP